MSERWAHRISAFFHPLFLNYAGFLLMLLLVMQRRHYSGKGFTLICVLYFINTVLLPLLFAGMLRLRGHIKSLRMDEQDERRLPFLATSVFYLVTYYLFDKLDLDSLLRSYVLASSAILIFTALINNFYKISIHAIAVGALLGLCLRIGMWGTFEMRIVLLALLPAAGLVLSARLFSAAHDSRQLLSGFLLGGGMMWMIV